MAVDALAQSWYDQYIYAFPPFILMAWVMQVWRGRASVLIALIWPWQHATALGMLVAIPVIVPASSLTLPQDTEGPSHQEPKDGCHETIRRQLAGKRLSPDVVDIISKSWRKGTNEEYRIYINKRLQFCIQWEIDSLSPSISHVLDFLLILSNKIWPGERSFQWASSIA